jgi:hypothetical protein
VFKYDAGLIKRYAREPFNELMDGRIILQVLEERRHWHA